MLDFHSHILPRVDDGSQGLEESLLMLSAMKDQGVTTVIATPHFYANDDSVDSFLSRRDAAYAALASQYTDVPRIILGAEVKYYEGISRLPDLKRLRIDGSRLLLLEMSMSKWSEYAVREVLDIAGQGRIIPVLAHVERYIFAQKKDVVNRLLENGVLFQSNSSFFTEHRTWRKAIKMVKDNQIHFLGSDCHNMTDRSPNVAKAFSQIQKKLGTSVVDAYMEYQRELFAQTLKN
jgi:protein-tyrosine phosphatase